MAVGPRRVLSIALISTGNLEENRSKASEHGVAGVYVQDGRAVNEAYGISGTPSAVLVAPNGAMTEPIATGADNIRQLLNRALAPVAPEVIQVPAAPPARARLRLRPRFRSRSPLARLCLSGGSPPSTAGGSTWPRGKGAERCSCSGIPQCGFCERLQDDLLAWEKARGPARSPAGADRRRPREHQPGAPLRRADRARPGQLDHARLRGARHADSALLIDGRGRVASELAVGGPAVLALASPGYSAAA